MRIAFISYECPPDTAVGGIGTYVLQAARALIARGEEVEVFSASPSFAGQQIADGVLVHRIEHSDIATFKHAIAPVFAERHRNVAFDVLEGPDYQADAAGAAALVPDIPLVVKLHTPSYLAHRLSSPPLGLVKEFRVRLGAYRRGIVASGVPNHYSFADERKHTLSADQVVSPSAALAQIVSKDWCIAPERISVIPNVFTPSTAYDAIAPGGDGRTIAFVGRLQLLKGILDLVDAIPQVVREMPHARFRLIGRSLASPDRGIAMDEYIRRRLGRAADHVEFTGHVPAAAIPGLIEDAQICVFPSYWENCPYVCLEAMAAARAIVATSNSGTAEMLGQGLAGVLVPPRSPAKLARAIVRLLKLPAECIRLGEIARQRVLHQYSCDAILPLQQRSYRLAIDQRQQIGPRIGRTAHVSDPSQNEERNATSA